MNRIESLARVWETHVAIPWTRGLSGSEKVWFCVYDKADERRLRLHLPVFAGTTQKAGHGWWTVDLTDAFAEWMASQEYRDRYFQNPSLLGKDGKGKIAEFLSYVAALIVPVLERAGEDGVVALTGVASLFGFVKVSDLTAALESHVRGRLVVFFPGEFENGNYRFLDARDGWSYRAIPILASEGAFSE